MFYNGPFPFHSCQFRSIPVVRVTHTTWAMRPTSVRVMRVVVLLSAKEQNRINNSLFMILFLKQYKMPEITLTKLFYL